MSRRVIDVSAMTSGHRSLEHLVVLTDVNLSAVLLCHTVNISALYKHCTIALPISAIMIIDVLAMTSGHRSLEHLVVPTDVNLLVVLLCHTVNISALYKHCTIALPISATMITDVLIIYVSASYRCLGGDQWPSVLSASCSADRCESLGGLTLSHSEYLGIIQALHDCIANQRYNDYRCPGEL